MFIINPLNGQRMDNLFSTHPNTQNRIAALQQLAHEWNNAPMQEEPQPAPRPPVEKAEPRNKRIVFGRNAGQMRQGIVDDGPWGPSESSKESNQDSTRRKGPWE